MQFINTYILRNRILIGLLPLLVACGQMRIEIDKLPPNTPEGAAVYVTGNFNNWNPGDPEYRLQRDLETQKWVAQIPLGFGKVAWKLTRGDWTTVESDSCGGDVGNRVNDYKRNTTLNTWVSGWKDLAPVFCNRITLVLDSIPENTPKGQTIYLSGNVNYWKLADRNFMFNCKENGKYYLTVPRVADKLVFKLNRGTWESVEMDEKGRDFDSREISFGNADTVHIAMRNWLDLPKPRQLLKTLVINKMPAIQAKQKIYLSGSFNNWNPKDEAYTFNKGKDGRYYYQFRFEEGVQAEYFKLTLGGWDNRELKFNGNEMNNRLLLNSGEDTLLIEVGKWAKTLPVSKVDPKKQEIQERLILNVYEAIKPEPPPPIKEKDAARKIIFIIDKAPEMRNSSDKIFIAGDFNDWVTDMHGYEFKRLPNGKYYYVLRLQDYKQHQYKLTRGDWGKEEADRNQFTMGNKNIDAGTKDDTIRIRIEGWADYKPAKRVTFCLTELPVETPVGSAIYLTGDFNNWQPADATYRFKPSNGKYYLTIPFFTNDYTFFKITRGEWDKEFSARNGRVLPDQRFRRYLKNDTMFFKVEGWKDLN